jgi:hypothetical protein
MKIRATCIECPWHSGTYKTGMTYHGAVDEGQAHHDHTGHAVSVPRFARGKSRIIDHVDKAMTPVPLPPPHA